MSRDLEKLTPEGMLGIWGLRVAGGSFRDPLRRSMGGIAGLDDEMAMVHYVESTEGFEASRPVLAHVYSEFLPVSMYRYRQPGETRMRAAIRHGQAHLLLEGWKDADLAQRLHDDFMDALVRKAKATPFKLPRRPEEVTTEDIVAEVEFAVAGGALASRPAYS